MKVQNTFLFRLLKNRRDRKLLMECGRDLGVLFKEDNRSDRKVLRTIWLKPETEEKLRELAFEFKTSNSELIRISIFIGLLFEKDVFQIINGSKLWKLKQRLSKYL